MRKLPPMQVPKTVGYCLCGNPIADYHFGGGLYKCVSCGHRMSTPKKEGLK